MLRTAFRLSVSIFFVAAALAQQPTPWKDPSKHTIQFVSVEPGVKLEVLDWGGTGRPCVLLAGYLTAHAYDEFAPKLTAMCHVFGITRRGFGASTRTESGYSAQRSADDVLAVLDSLKLVKPVLAGHSFGGQDITTISEGHSDHIAAIVYLNSAEDPTLTMPDYDVKAPDPKLLPAAMRAPDQPDFRSFQAYREWQMRAHGVEFPESELRQMYAVNPDGSMGAYLVPSRVRDAIFAGRKKPDYAAIRVPVLAFFAGPQPFDQLVKKYQPKDAQERQAMEQGYAGDLAIRKRHLQDLQHGVPNARIVTVPDANFYIFLSNPEELLRDLCTFLGALVKS